MLLKVVKQDPTQLMLAISGRLDMAGVREIEINFTEQIGNADRNVIVDMSEVPFLASLGMRMFLSAAKKLRVNDKTLALLNPDDMVKDAMRIAGMDKIIPLVDSEEELA